MRPVRIFLLIALVLLALFCVPWSVLMLFPQWPTPVLGGHRRVRGCPARAGDSNVRRPQSATH